MKITVRYFAQLKDLFKRESDVVDLQDKASVADLLARIFPDPTTQEKMASFLRVAVNQEYASPESPLNKGDEVVFIPPVAGG